MLKMSIHVLTPKSAGQMADAKVVQKSLSFLKRMWSTVRFLQGGRQSWSDILYAHRSS